MARYGGGHEDLNEERALLGQIETGLDKLTAKERAARREVEATDEAVSRSTRERERLSRIQREQRQVQERAAEVSNVEAQAIDRTTAAIERNAVAREAAMRAAVNTNRALAGAQDPLFGRATALGREGLPPSQYQMRKELGIGSGRAQRLQEAIQAGYAPARPGVESDRPLTAQRAVVQADIERAAAQRAYTNAIRRGDQAAAEEAAAARDEAQARKESATAHLKSARSASAEARVVDERAAQVAGTPPSTALVPRTAAAGAVGGRVFGEEPFRGALPAYGRTYPTKVFGVGGAGNEGPDVRVGPRGGRYDVAQIQQAAVANTHLAAAEREAARDANLEQRALANQAVAANATQTDRLARATRFAAVEYGTANQQIRQHGTLTSEFIQAALRGETTLRELGNQALVTAGKFGAWTGAATAIFGAVAAVHQLGTGAIQSSAGVNQLQRVVNNVNGDKLQQQFSDLAGEFNVPIEVATDAVYQMGKVFHNQGDAVTAARAALYSYKTGEVDVASSTQSLIAIVNGFGLSAQDLTKVYDQINQAQNKFGIGIGDVEQGLAKAGGTYRNAGGDLNYLLALFVAIQKATGRSGTEIGTGIARGVNQIRNPINQARLKAQGVDVDPQNFQKTIQSALEAAKKPGADLQQIASGLFGNQYARLIAPVLRDQTRLNKALGDTSPEASKGSAQRELSRVLGSVDEQIKKVGVSLQRLGAGLARAGLGDIPYLLLRGLTGVLDIAVKVVDVFDKLPAPLRHALSLLGEVAIAMRVIRRFGGLPGIAEKVPGAQFLAAPNQLAKNRAVAGARMAQEEADRALESATQRASSLHQAASVRATQTAEYNARYAARERAGTLPAEHTDEFRALQQQRIDINEESAAAERQAAAATREANVQRELALNAEREKVRLEQMDAALVRQEAEARQLAVPASFNVPERRGAVLPGGRAIPGIDGAPGTAGAAVGLAGGGGRDVTAHIAEMERQAKQFEETPRQMNRYERAILPYTSGLRVWGDKLSESNAVTRPVGALANRTAGLADRAAANIKGGASALRGMGSRMAAFATSLGPLDVALIAFFAFEGLKSMTDKVRAEQDRALKAIEAFPTSAGQLKARNEAIASALDRTKQPFFVPGAKLPGIRGAAQGIAQSGKYSAENFVDTLTLKPFIDPDYETTAQTDERKIKEARLAKGEEDRIKRIQAKQRATGRPVPLQTLDQVTAQMDADAKLREQGIITLGEWDKRQAKHIIEMKTARNQTEAARRAAEQKAAELAREASPTLYGRYAGAPADEIRTRLTNLGSVVSTGDATKAQLREYGYAYRQLVTKEGTSSDPKTVAQFLQDRDAYFKALEDGANATLQYALAAAQTEGERQAAFRHAGQQLRQLPDADRTQLRADEGRLVKAGQKIVPNRAKHAVGQTTREFLQNIIDKGGGAIPGVTAARDKVIEYEKKLDADLKKDQGDIAKYQKAIKADRKHIHDALKKSDRLTKANAEAAFQDAEQGRDTSLTLAQSKTRDPLKQAQLAVASAQKSVADAKKRGNVRDRKAAEAKLNQAENQADDALLARAQALDSVREAQVALRTGGDPVAMARAAEQSAQNTYNFLKAHSDDPTAIAQAYAQVLQSQAATAQAALDQANQLAGIQFDLAAARAGGGAAALAHAAQQKAQYALAHAKNKVQRAQALLDLANANNQAEQAAADAEASRFELLASLTDDPVKKAQYQLKGDRALLKHAHGPAEHNRAQAKVNDDLRAVRDQKLQGKEDDIDFNLEMERINRQTAIEQYQSLLKMHNLTKAQRRDILRKIHSLQKEGESEASGFGLQVGQGVKLPTIYDVRRAISGVQRAMSHNLTYQAKTQSDAMRDAITGARGGNGGGAGGNANTRIVVNVEVTDPNSAGKVFDQIDKALSTGVRSNVRSAGLTL